MPKSYREPKICLTCKNRSYSNDGHGGHDLVCKKDWTKVIEQGTCDEWCPDSGYTGKR